MRLRRHALWAVVAAAALVACGGGDPYEPGSEGPSGAPATKGSFTAVVAFGDSLSDIGTYQPATQVPNINPPLYFGGKFTTNFDLGASKSTVWVENVASALGITMTPAEVGFAGQSVKCPAALANPALAATCTGYAQGGARITDPNGIRHDSGALTVPLRTQIANHLAAFGSFKASDLVLIWAGGNDFFHVMERDPARNPNSYVVKLGQIQAALQAGQITLEQAQAAGFQAQVATQAVMKQVALELAAYIKAEILGKGAKYVLVANLPNPALTPEGAATAAAVPTIGAAMSTFAETYNLWLREGLKGQPVLWFDMAGVFQSVVSNPAAYGIAVANIPACDIGKMATATAGAITDGFSLFCSAMPIAEINGIRAGADINTWMFADGNHPSTGGHRVIGEEALKAMRAAGWM